MRSKSIVVIGALLAVIMIFGTSPYAQVDWFADGAGITLSNDSTGKASDATLEVILGVGAQLTVGNWMEIDLGSFQVDESAAETESNYTFFGYSSDAQLKMGSTDFSADFTESTGIVRLTLVEDNSLVPSDSLRIIISNVLTNSGTKGAASTDDYTINIRTSDQPVFASDNETDSQFGIPNDNAISAITVADSLSKNTNWIMITLTANGQFPKDGLIDVILPDSFSFNTSVVNIAAQKDTIVVKDDGVVVTLDAVSASGRTLRIDLNNANPIADGSVVTIQLGSAIGVGKVINNPTVFSRAASNNNQTITYTDGFDNGIVLSDNATSYTVMTFDADGDTISLDKTDDTKSFLIRSNWFPQSTANAGQGGVFI